MIRNLLRRLILWAVPEANTDTEDIHRQLRSLDNRVRRQGSR